MPENQSKSSSPKSSGSDKNASKEQNYVPLKEIAENVFSYFKKFDHFKKYEKDITKKYQKYYKTTEALPDCWSHDFINKAWRKTEKMYEYSGRRKCWSLAILFQVMKRSCGYDENETEAQSVVKKESPQSGADPSANKPVYIRIPFSEMINGKECYRSDTDTNIVAMDKESKASETVAMDIIESPYKLIDRVPSPTQILQNKFYITLYDNQTRNAAWVYEILNESPKANNNVVKPNNFKEDDSVHPLFQPSTDKYSSKRYNQGHLAAAANHSWCQEALNDTYCLSNAVPQQRDFNSGPWNKLEEYCREIAEKMEVRNVHVYTGPLYLSSDRESKANNDQNKSEKRVEYEIVGGKAVPTHLFKVIIVENKDGKVLAPECYKMPNENINRIQHKDQSKFPPKKLPIRNFTISTIDTKSGKVIDKTVSKNPKYIIESIKKQKENLERYKVEMEEIQRDSGLIFEEREVREKMTEGTQKVHRRKNPEEPGRGTLIEVKISGSYTDHSDRAVLH